MRNAGIGRSHLKSSLLLGAAGMVATMGQGAMAADATAPATPAPSAAPPATTSPSIPPLKYLPYADIGGGAGSGFTVGRINTFTPVWQDIDSLLFVRLGVDTRTNASADFNLGLGYRTKIDGDWILGVFGGFDSTQTNYDHTFNQFSLGAEAMSADWDVRINGYDANKDNRAIGGKYGLYIHDTTIGILQAQETALSGFDGEVGYRVFNTDTTDVRVFVGGYTFHHSSAKSSSTGQTFDLNYHDESGPKARAEVNVFDLDMLGAQSRLSVDGEVSHDNVNHTSAYIGATLRIPLNDISGGGAQALDDLDRRMVDPVRRNDNVLTQYQFNKPEPVIIYDSHITSQPTNTVLYAENRSSAGAGTYKDPTTVQDATSRGPKNQFIVLTSAGGSKIDATGTVVQSGETIVGGGPSAFTVRGIDSNAKFTHVFAPGSSAVSLTGTTGANLLTVGSNVALEGFAIDGPFGNAIYGHNVTGITIDNLDIEGGGTGTNGIVFNESSATKSTIDIDNTTIAGVTGDGIKLDVTMSSGTSSTALNISKATVDAVTNGVDITSSTTGSANATVDTTITDSTISSAGTAVSMTDTSAAGSTLTHSLTIDPTVLHGGQYGLVIDAEATGGTLNQTVTLSNVTATDSSFADILGKADAHGGGTINQTLSFTDVTATGSTEGDGIFIIGTASDSGTVLQHVSISDLTATGNADTGARFNVSAYNDTAGKSGVAAQYLSISDSNLNANRNGVYLYDTAFNESVTRQDISISKSTLDGNSADGLFGRATALDSAAANQYVYLVHDHLDGNAFGGAYLSAVAANGAFAAQTIVAYHDTFNSNGGDGILIDANATSAGEVEQNATLYYTNANHNAGSGVDVQSFSAGYKGATYYYYSHIQQNVTAVYDAFSHNKASGVNVNNETVYGGKMDQSVFLYGVTADANKVGFSERSVDITEAGNGYALSTNLTSNVYLYKSHFDDNATNGISVKSNLVAPLYTPGFFLGYSYLEQKLTVSGSTASHDGHDGIFVSTSQKGVFGLNEQVVTLAGSTFDYNKNNGAYFLSHSNYGPGSFGAALQEITIEGSHLDHNKNSGLIASAVALGVQGRAEQNFTIEQSTFDNNKVNGIYLYRTAHDGVLKPGYACYDVQGLPGGCAFVRQEVKIIGSEAVGNGNDGLKVVSNIYNYGAVYDASGRPHAPTLYMLDSTFSNNGGNGLEIDNAVVGASYLFQFVEAVDSHFDNNGLNGISSTSYASTGSVSVQHTILYSYKTGTTLSGNGDSGASIVGVALNGSYAVTDVLAQGVTASDNKGTGIGSAGIYVAAASLSVGSYSVSTVQAYGNTFSNEQTGILSVVYGPGGIQYNHIGGNVAKHDGTGIAAYSGFYAYQTVDVSTGNTQAHNGANYHFYTNGGIQNVTY